MFPLHDDNPTRSTPILTIILIVINLCVFLAQISWEINHRGEIAEVARVRVPVSDLAVYRYALIPAEISGQQPDVVAEERRYPKELEDRAKIAAAVNYEPAWFTVFFSMFMHGSWMHLIGNMWFLWIFGNNIEDRLGKVRYLLFYLVCGVLAAATHVLLEPGSPIPTVGASGAIAGVLGGYLLLWPHARVTTLITLIIITVIELPAGFLLLGWFILQAVQGFIGMGGQPGGGVAYGAHVGGFVAGLALIKLFGGRRELPPRRYYSRPDNDRW